MDEVVGSKRHLDYEDLGRLQYLSQVSNVGELPLGRCGDSLEPKPRWIQQQDGEVLPPTSIQPVVESGPLATRTETVPPGKAGTKAFSLGAGSAGPSNSVKPRAPCPSNSLGGEGPCLPPVTVLPLCPSPLGLSFSFDHKNGSKGNILRIWAILGRGVCSVGMGWGQSTLLLALGSRGFLHSFFACPL